MTEPLLGCCRGPFESLYWWLEQLLQGVQCLCILRHGELALARSGTDTYSPARQGRCNSDPNSRSVIILITDSCPECEADHLDIQVEFLQYHP